MSAAILEENEQLKAALASKEETIAQLKAQLEYLKKKLFGTGKSEKYNSLQLELLQAQIDGLEQREPKTHTVEKHQRKKRAALPSREEAYEHLPIKQTVEHIPQEVQENPEAYERTGACEETFEIDYEPPRFERIRHIRPKFRVKADRSKALITASAPLRVVEGLPSNNLLATIMIGKFLDHLPLHRQARIYKRQGCKLSVESMVRWVEKVSIWLEPLYQAMQWELLQGDYLQADETPVSFCDPDLGINQSKKGYFCVYTRPGDNVVFVWRRSRSTQAVTRFLEGYKGILHSDAYYAYIEYARDHKEITLLCCMAHARRYFDKAKQHYPRECALALKLIGKLYKVEKEIRDAEQPLSREEIVEKRKGECAWALGWLKRLATVIVYRVRPGQSVRKACDYLLKHWERLSEYLNHGQAQIDNNIVENRIRPTALGRRNWLFIGHPEAGDRAAIIYSVLISCQSLGVDPHQYLKEVFKHDTSKMTREQLTALTPSAYLPKQQPSILAA